jgi:glycyl-tRNA synthetase
MYDKNQRVGALVQPLAALFKVGEADQSLAQHAATIVKADLATQIVVEMTNLQGIMGREYAAREGQASAVANAIYEHWLPRSADDELPASASGMLLALADRLDSLVGLFAAGLAPRSTADPYGLRRAALGVVQIVVAKKLDVNLAEAVAIASAAQPITVSAAVQAEVLEFIGGRLRSWLEDQDWRRDVLAAVLAEQSASPYRAVTGLRELSGWVSRADWEPLLDGFARCVRITRAEKETYAVNPASFVDDAERSLYAAYQTAAGKLNAASNVDAFLSAFELVLPEITRFFEAVMVNAEDASVRRNRLGLLQAITALAKSRADLSFLTGF